MSIINGDCLEEMPKMAKGSVDMILTDLPYGMTACKWDSVIDLRKRWNCFNHVIKDNGAIILTASQPFTSRLVMSNPEMFKHEWVWEKSRHTNFMAMKYQPAKIHESVLVFGKNTVVYNPIKWYVSEDKIDKRKTVRDPDTNKDGYVNSCVPQDYYAQYHNAPQSVRYKNLIPQALTNLSDHQIDILYNQLVSIGQNNTYFNQYPPPQK